jgi:hypothetical protein
MASGTETAATIDDLYRVEGKAELIAGRIVHFMASGSFPSQVAFEIAISLREYAQRRKDGTAFPDGVGYAIDPPLASGRQSFSPDASYYDGPPPRDRMRFLQGPPTFAAEVRSEGDYGPAAEAEMAAKRADYFEAGTRAVWDVDPIAGLVRLYTPGSAAPITFKAGDEAHAETAVPGWRVAVDRLFG